MRYIRNLSYEPNAIISESITNNHLGIWKCHKLSGNTYLSNAIEAGKNTTFCKENKLSVTARFAMRRFAVLCLMYPLYTVKITNKLPTSPKERYNNTDDNSNKIHPPNIVPNVCFCSVYGGYCGESCISWNPSHCSPRYVSC